MSDFSIRLKSLRKENDKNQEDLALLLEVKRATISAYETGKVMPPYDKLAMLADYFRVSMEYLMGKTNSREKQPENIDVTNALRVLLNQLSDEESNLTVDGVELDSSSRELLINSIENSLKMGKLLAQSKKE